MVKQGDIIFLDFETGADLEQKGRRPAIVITNHLHQSRWTRVVKTQNLPIKETKRNILKIAKITKNKKQFLDLLLLADEQEDMIDNYLPSGDLFALYDDDLKSVCVVVPIDGETCELKNIATYEKYQGKGYGKALIHYICDFYQNDYKTMLVGTGETPSNLVVL